MPKLDELLTTREVTEAIRSKVPGLTLRKVDYALDTIGEKPARKIGPTRLYAPSVVQQLAKHFEDVKARRAFNLTRRLPKAEREAAAARSLSAGATVQG